MVGDNCLERKRYLGGEEGEKKTIKEKIKESKQQQQQQKIYFLYLIFAERKKSTWP